MNLFRYFFCTVCIVKQTYALDDIYNICDLHLLNEKMPIECIMEKDEIIRFHIGKFELLYRPGELIGINPKNTEIRIFICKDYVVYQCDVEHDYGFGLLINEEETITIHNLYKDNEIKSIGCEYLSNYISYFRAEFADGKTKKTEFLLGKNIQEKSENKMKTQIKSQKKTIINEAKREKFSLFIKFQEFIKKFKRFKKQKVKLNSLDIDIQNWLNNSELPR